MFQNFNKSSSEGVNKADYDYDDSYMQDSGSEYEADRYDNRTESSEDSADSDSDYENEETGFRRLDASSGDSSGQQSLYMTAKKKHLIIKDGKILGRSKSQRKNKGESFVKILFCYCLPKEN